MKIECKRCLKTDIKKAGKKMQMRGERQRFKCRECGYTFVVGDGRTNVYRNALKHWGKAKGVFKRKTDSGLLKILRIKYNLSQDALALALGVNRSYISQIERGTLGISKRILALIENRFVEKKEMA